MPEPGRWPTAAIRNLYLYLGGMALSAIGTFSQRVALSLLVLDITNSGFALGATMSVEAVPMLLLSPWSGALLDRLPLRRVLLVTALVGGLQATILTVLALTGSITLPMVLALAFLIGCVQAFDRPAAQAFLVELVPREMLPRAVSLGSTIQAFGRLGGPALAAVLYAWRGAELIFGVNAISYLAVVIALALLQKDAMFPRTRHPGQRAHLSEALRYAWHSPVLRPVLLGNAVVGLFAFNFGTFFAMTATLTFGQPSLFGLAESLNAVTAILAGFVLARYLKTPTLLTVGLAGLGLGSSLAWVALAPSPFLFLASMPYFGFAVVAYGATAQALVQQRSPREMAGRMMSLYTLGTMGTTPLGGLIVGWVSDQATVRVAVGLGAASASLVGLMLLVRWWWDRRASGIRAVLEPDPENPRII